MRKILIIPIGEVDDYLQMAADNDIGEIVEGIPKALEGLYREEDLPIIHEEEEAPPAPSELDLLGQQLVEKDLQILELQQENQTLGSQIVDLDLRLLQGGL